MLSPPSPRLCLRKCRSAEPQRLSGGEANSIACRNHEDLGGSQPTANTQTAGDRYEQLRRITLWLLLVIAKPWLA